MGIKNLILRKAENVAGKAADVLAKAAVLSPGQIEKIDVERQKYLLEKPDPDDEASKELTQKLLATISVEFYNVYLKQISKLYVPIEKDAEYENKFNPEKNIRFANITKWVTDKTENSLEKLVNVYDVLSNEECNVALVFHRTAEKTDVYIAITNTKNDNDHDDANIYIKRLEEAIKGNFPGSEMRDYGTGSEEKKYRTGIIPCLENETPYSVASVSNIPSEKSEKFISQTIEKLLDGVIPENGKQDYIIVLLATPVHDVEERKLHLAEFYSTLLPYSSWQTTFNVTESNCHSSTGTLGVNLGVGAGIQRGANQTKNETDVKGEGKTLNESESNTKSDSESNTESNSKSNTESKSSTNSVSGGAYAGGNIGFAQGGVHTEIGRASTTGSSVAKTVGKSVTKMLGNAITKTTGKAITETIGKAVGVAKGISKATNFGVNFGTNFARSSSVTATVGKNEGITQSFTNYNIKHTLELLEEQMKRLEQSSALGMWDFAAYVLSEDFNIANNVAHSYLALTQGEESFMSSSAVNLWRGDIDGESSEKTKEICSYIRELRHPVFGLDPKVVKEEQDFNVYPLIVTATTSLSGKELAYSLNFPRKSVAGLPVIECAEFGRNISSYNSPKEGEYKEKDKDFYLDLGHIFHMNHREEMKVAISGKSLASHTFITGSTGSGKSNTVYKMLENAWEKGIKFLVVEPAKGEYKNIFGNDKDVSVYGTNPKLTPLLKINPFSFPEDIHVLEHLDRLVEIFNVCWPMYAAMPAVLKNAMEKSYEDCGWDLVKSENEFGKNLYPNFADVARNIKLIIESSEYDSESKGAYKGALLTRLKSLSDGINRMIFASDEIPFKKLFDENVIIDLSRVGSSETKSLLMGMIVLKLQEYRLSKAESSNVPLKHLTVLEEAHNILKRTSTEQFAEGSNLIGKSVEMITNAIAEMRTFGEGFIIVDQAPGLVDMAAIRNTNTKIIMRLPDQSDRELVGRAANLNDDQITELAKLPCGVAAIYQNEWIQSILCKIEKCSIEEEKYKCPNNSQKIANGNVTEKLKIAELLSKGTKIQKNELSDIASAMERLNLDAFAKVTTIKILQNPSKEPRMTKLAPIMAALFPEVEDAVKKSYFETHEAKEWTASADAALRAIINMQIDEQVRRDIIQAVITHYFINEINRQTDLQEWHLRGGLA